MAPIISAIITAILALSIWIGLRRHRRSLSMHLARLTSAAAQVAAIRVDAVGTGDLPPPVARYLRWALPHCRAIRVVRMHQAGTLRTSVKSGRWLEFEADHLALPAATGFLWDAKVSVAPVAHVRVRDSYFKGQGSGQVSLLSAFTLSADAGTLEMNSGALHRFLAEAVWYPTALLPSSKLRWTPIDSRKALATLTDHGVSVSLEFLFTETGELMGIYTPGRWARFGGGYRQLPWEGRFRNYRLRDGILVPTEGHVGWYVDGEFRMVWRGSITKFEINGESI